MRISRDSLLAWAVVVLGCKPSHAFVVSPTATPQRTSPSSLLKMSSVDEESAISKAWESLQADLQMRWGIAKASNAEGSNFKQVMADVLAGEYDAAPIQQQIEADIQSAPVVMYTWKASPSCKSAIHAFEIILGVESLEEEVGDDLVRIIRLDNPWSEGNPIRAQLGKKVGLTSVPCIFIGGKYVGGFDAGMGADAPGIQAMAFQGTLRPALEAAGLTLPSTGGGDSKANTAAVPKTEDAVVSA